MPEQPSEWAMERADAWIAENLGHTTDESIVYGYVALSKSLAAALDAARREGRRAMREEAAKVAHIASELYDDRAGGFESGAYRVAVAIEDDIGALAD